MVKWRSESAGSEGARTLLVEDGPMRFVSAVALALVMLWVPVDGVAQLGYFAFASLGAPVAVADW